MKVQVAAIIFTVILIGSATYLRSASDLNRPIGPLELTDNNVASALNNSSFIILDFYYPGCGPCKSMNNTTSALSSELQGQARFARMNVREKENRQTVQKYKISAYPTLLFFNEGILVNRMKGNISKSDLLAAIEDVMPSLDESKMKVVQAAVSPNASPETMLALEQACANATKSDKPLLEAFIVSRCPFGLQMQRIMAEMTSKLPQARDYLKVRYIGSVSNNTITSMHGDEEAQENLRQICIREEQGSKYWDYVSCYMKEGNSTECLKSSSVDEGMLNACVKDSSRGLTYAQKDFDLANKFNVAGSPTLILNNKIASEFDFATNTTSARSPEALKELLCCGFNKEPSFCAEQLNRTPAITMFQINAPTTTAAAQQTIGKIIPLIRPGTKNPAQAMLITDATIDSAISEYRPLLVIVGFTDSCGYCRMFNVTISELSRELQGQIAFGMIETQKNNDTEAKYNITGVPTALIFKDGRLADKIIGNTAKSNVVAKLKGIEPKLNTSKVKTVKAASTIKAPAKPKLTPEQVCVNMTKSDQPLLQAFVVSKCPFGLQVQRIMANIINESKDTEQYLKVMYIGSLDPVNNTIKSMHGAAEARENLRQICIREEQPGKYWDYLRCYIREGKSADCQKSVSLDVDKLNACTNDSSRGLVYAQKDFDMADKYKITGSPTMLMNGKIVKESDFATSTTNSRSPEAIKELLCCGFNKEPSFCSLEMNRSRMATMFSTK
jgi:thioredoxin 1